jgi:hypothetical protein
MLTTHGELLSKLSKMIEEGTLTKADRVDLGTFVCFTQMTPMGIIYHQGNFEALPSAIRMCFLGATPGAIIEPYKICAVFHVWLKHETKVVPVKVCYN